MYYTYHIGWSQTNKHYYGVRGTLLNPIDDLWIKYFTSSKYVREYRKEYGEPDIIEIRKLFIDRVSALEWEHKVLVRMHTKISSDWLNRYDGSYKGSVGPKGHGAKISASTKGIPKTEEHKNSVRLAITGSFKWFTDGEKNIQVKANKIDEFILENQNFKNGVTILEITKERMSKSRLRLLNEGIVKMPTYDKSGCNNPMYGKEQSEESKNKSSETNKKRLENYDNRLFGEKNGMFGKTHSDELKKATSDRVKKMKWYNNGISNLYILDGKSVPEGYIRGRLTGWNTQKNKNDKEFADTSDKIK